nr:hypothetical protein [Tanacetum cinerariifolium]
MNRSPSPPLNLLKNHGFIFFLGPGSSGGGGGDYPVATATIKKVNDVVQLRALIDGKKVVVTEDVIRQDLHLDDADGVECLPNAEIFVELARMGYEKPPPRLTFYKAFFSAQWKFLIHTLVQCVSAKRTAWNVFIFSMASAVICLATEEDDDILTAPIPPTPTNAPSSPLQDPIPTPPPAQPATPHSTPPQEQPTATFESSMSLLNTLMETSQEKGKEVREEEEIKVFRFKEDKKGGKIKAIDANRDITLVDVETQVDMNSRLQGRIDQDVSAATKDVSAAEPTVFDDEKVTMTMAQKLIKMKAKKTKLLDEQISQRLHDEEIKKAAARDKQEKDDLERAQALQKQYDDKEYNTPCYRVIDDVN